MTGHQAYVCNPAFRVSNIDFSGYRFLCLVTSQDSNFWQCLDADPYTTSPRNLPAGDLLDVNSINGIHYYQRCLFNNKVKDIYLVK